MRGPSKTPSIALVPQHGPTPGFPPRSLCLPLLPRGKNMFTDCLARFWSANSDPNRRQRNLIGVRGKDGSNPLISRDFENIGAISERFSQVVRQEALAVVGEAASLRSAGHLRARSGDTRSR